MLVKDIMDRDLTSLAEDTTLLEAIALLAAHDTSGLPVLGDGGKVIGFLSEKDILRSAIPGYLGYMDENFAMPDVDKIKARVKRVGRDPARDYMTKDAIVFDEEETISNAMVALFKKNIRRAPVVKDGSLVGMVNREEILKGFVHDNFEDGEVEIPVGGDSSR
ncbi:MAG: CBS domain-containing protein [Synergistaceae bacterium]|jgi:CBS domain-containing protein|nr:CBS domain-containing protein [Synergistaceae bacterium]